MQEITHPQLVAALVKPPLDIMTTLSQFSTDLWHGATGVAGEAGELLEMISGGIIDIENLVEELGDLEFYMEQIRQRTSIERIPEADHFADSFEFDAAQNGTVLLMLTVDLVVEATKVLDYIKKCAIYNKELDRDNLSTALSAMDAVMAKMRKVAGVQRETVLMENIRKLSKRYASLNYSDKAAQERADKAAPQRKPFPGEPRTSDMADVVAAESGAQN